MAVSLLLTAPEFTDYIGPQRTSTELVQMRDPDNDVWTIIHVDPHDQYAYVCLIIHTCEEHPSIERQQALCSWPTNAPPRTGSGKANIDVYSVPFQLFKSRPC